MDKFYYELKITPSTHYNLYLELILSLTNEAIEESLDTIIIRSQDNLQNIKEGIDTFTKALEVNLSKPIKCTSNIIQKENEDWIQKYKDSVKPINIAKFHVHPSWTPAENNKINILIDPALTFGSGHHETTNSCLEAISKYVTNKHHVIDVGCGSGILGIAASKLDAKCDICDTDQLAVQDALKNAKSNNIVFNNSWQGSAIQTKLQYDIVLANIVADVLVIIQKDLKKILKNNGILILSGILTIYEDKVLKKFINNNETKILEIIHKNEWTTLVLQKENIDE